MYSSHCLMLWVHRLKYLKLDLQIIQFRFITEKKWGHEKEKWINYSRFPTSSVGKESTCNAGDPGSIPRSGRSAGEGIGYSLQYSWTSLVAQLVKNPPTMRETWVWSLGWENALEKGKATHSGILAWRIPWTSVHRGRKESDMTERLLVCSLLSI